MADVLRVDQAPVVDEATRIAVRAVVRGTASASQQKLAFNFLLRTLAPISSAQPAALTEREGGFLSGRAWVGFMIAEVADIRVFDAAPDEGDDDGS